MFATRSWTLESLTVQVALQYVHIQTFPNAEPRFTVQSVRICSTRNLGYTEIVSSALRRKIIDPMLVTVSPRLTSLTWG